MVGVHLLLDVTALSLPGHLCARAISWSSRVSLLPFASRTCSLLVTCAEAALELPQPEVEAGPVFVLGCELSLQTHPVEVEDHSLGILCQSHKRGSVPCRRAVRCLLSHDYCPLGQWLGTRESTSTMLQENTGQPGNFPPAPAPAVLHGAVSLARLAHTRVAALRTPKELLLFCLEHKIVWGHFCIFFSQQPDIHVCSAARNPPRLDTLACTPVR